MEDFFPRVRCTNQQKIFGIFPKSWKSTNIIQCNCRIQTNTFYTSQSQVIIVVEFETVFSQIVQGVTRRATKSTLNAWINCLPWEIFYPPCYSYSNLQWFKSWKFLASIFIYTKTFSSSSQNVRSTITYLKNSQMTQSIIYNLLWFSPKFFP